MNSFFGFKSKSAKHEDAVNKGPVTHDVILQPPTSSRLLPPKPKQEGDDEKVRQLRTFLEEYCAAHPCDPAYEPYEARWMNNEMMYHRVLRSVRHDLKHAKKRIQVRSSQLTHSQDTLEWRRDFRPEVIPPDEVAPEAETGKHVITGFDKESRPILYLRPGLENTKPSPRQIRYMPGQESITIVVDFRGASLSTMPSLHTARHVANILQAYYCERLGRAFVVHMPRFISAFFNALSPFLDPVTKDKIRFQDTNMTEFIEPEQLDAQFHGGQYHYQFDFPIYWSSLVQRCGIAQGGQRQLN
ncbi:4-nitrophenylphosphatase [Malassezia equina]|uniref:4-nitrophenylphosphatase n=1 Tax=Malassezia equina TaxID=1381935 RepID=A0AAF0IZ68_9BASI|nr:4-nitrophenylphosphatase [Malassezia equina]